jgi:hypothetical protein
MISVLGVETTPYEGVIGATYDVIQLMIQEC